MSAINQIKFITELNLLTTKLGYFPVKIVGILFLYKKNIVMAELESPKCINIQIEKERDLKKQRLIRPF